MTKQTADTRSKGMGLETRLETSQFNITISVSDMHLDDNDKDRFRSGMYYLIQETAWNYMQNFNNMKNKILPAINGV